ncbi:MAG: alpha/beta hydrolase [SAR86 cluster bacterium]|nr:alpha/beta hydrolase [SAR86 cluster bacterium]
MDIPSWFNDLVAIKSSRHSVRVDSANISYQKWGNPNKPGLLFIHGYAANSHWWDFIAPCFLDDYSVVAMDLSGMGDSDHRSNYSQDIYALEIKSVIEDMGWKEAKIVAHSMSGPISVKAASLYPELISSLYIIDSMVVLPPDKLDAFKNSGRSMIRADFIYKDYDSAIKAFRLLPPQPVRHNFILNYIAEHSYKEEHGGWVLKSDGKIMSTYEAEDLTDIFMNLKCPIYIVYGLMSQILSAGILEYMTYVGQIPKSRQVGIPGAMHHLFLDEPTIFAKELRKLLGDK